MSFRRQFSFSPYSNIVAKKVVLLDALLKRQLRDTLDSENRKFGKLCIYVAYEKRVF